MKGCIRMKKAKLLSLLMAIIFVLTLIVACKPNEPEYVYPSEEILYLRENLPSMDGSTSLIPLEAGLRAKIFNISINEATADVKHSTTYGSFERLLNGEVDLIFSTPLSEEQYDQAAQKGMDLELVPIAAEAFVFVINANNPVESLTQQQIKDIYSGKITNWKEVGGEDIEIVAFQRNQTSGSQNYMRDFMGDTELAVAPTDTVPSSMGSLMEAIAAYDNSQNAIGYSVYAYAADMYGLGDKMKFVKVDGVAPTKDSMNDKSYPLTNYNYVIYDKNSVTESTERMVKWICSDEGQQAVADAGYIPANVNIGRKYLEIIGTGTKIPKEITVQSYKYTANLILEKILPENFEEINENTILFQAKYEPEAYKFVTGIKWEISGLADKDLQNRINEKISEMTSRADERTSDFINYIIKLNDSSLNDYELYFPISDRENGTSYYLNSWVTAEVLNGYLCIVVEQKYCDGADVFTYNYFTETAFFDLYTGEELQLTDIFYKDVDIASILNNYFSDFKFEKDSYVGPVQLKTLKDFTQFSADDSIAISFNKIFFNHNNTILKDCVFFNMEFPWGSRIVEEPRDMEGIFEASVDVEKSLIMKSHYTYETVEGASTIFATIPETGPLAEANRKINEAMRKIVKTTPSKEDLEAAYKVHGREYNESYLYYFSAEEYVGNVILFNGATEGYDNIYRTETIVFDAQTGERIYPEDLLKEGWQDHASFTNIRDKLTDKQKAQIDQKIIPYGVYLDSIYLVQGSDTVVFGFCYTDVKGFGWTAFYLNVDKEYVEINN